MNLTSKNQKVYTILRIVIGALFVFIGLIILDKIIFPAQVLTYNFDNQNALANTLDTAQSQNSQTILNAAAMGNFDVAKITLNLRKEKNDFAQNDRKVIIRKGYYATFLPISKEFAQFAQTANTLQPGDLLTYKNGIGVVTSDNAISPIDTAETLLAKGYLFDNVAKGKNYDLSNFSKGKLFTLRTPHPNGTIIHFTNKENSQYYQVNQSSLQQIDSTKYDSNDNLRKIAITTQFAARETTTNCNLRKWRNKLSCTANLTPIAQFAGPIYNFNININSTNIQSAKITLKRSRTLQNARTTLTQIKNRLMANYR